MNSGQSVLILTNQQDSAADLVVEHLNARRVPVFRCDTAEFPTQLSLSAKLGARNWIGRLSNAYRSLHLESVRSVYFRRPRQPRLAHGMSPASREFAAAQSRAGFVGISVALPCLWVNHPARDLDANHKPWQLATAAALGLRPPRSIITNDPSEARRFATGIGGPIITKSLGAPVRTVVVDPESIDDSVKLCAHLFQEWVNKAHEVRLTVVGEQFFGVEIHAGTDAGRLDWRSDYANLTYAQAEVPSLVRDRVIEFMRFFGLVFAAFDFVVMPSGEWRFLEVNPNGQWAWLEHHAGVRISQAIADLLQGGAIR